MVLMSIGGALLGAVFGLRFKVLVLLPAILLGATSIAVIGTMLGTPISTIVINTMACNFALQLGYLAGLFCRFVMVGARARVPQSNSLARAPR
jgi:hypothetical protein